MLQPTTPKQRKPHYEDVESLLSPGFLTHTLSVGGTRLALRTLSPGDLFLLKTRAAGLPDREWQHWAIASSIWMVNGVNLLEERNFTPRLYKMVCRLPHRARRILYSAVIGLFARADRASEGVEAYIYEDSSRSRWRMLGKAQFSEHLGVPGANSLGANFVQQIWTAFNQVEDERHDSERQWEGFKLVASTHAPKGVQKMDQKDKQRAQEESARRQAVMDRFCYYREGLIDRRGYHKDQNHDLTGAVIHQPKSASQLSDEMRRWVEGEHDLHDMIVENYKNQILARREAEEREREQRRLALQAELERREEAEMEPLPMVAYSPRQLQQILSDRNAGKARGRRIYDDSRGKTERYVGGFLAKEQRRGLLKKTAEGALVDADPHAVRRHQSLQSALESRQVQMETPEPARSAPARPNTNHPNPQVQAYYRQQQRMAGEANVEGLVNPDVFGGQGGGSR